MSKNARLKRQAAARPVASKKAKRTALDDLFLAQTIRARDEAIKGLDEFARRELKRISSGPVPVLSKTERRGAEFIRANPGAQAKEIAKHCGIEPACFTVHIAPQLKKAGFTSRRGCTGGYYPPKPESPQS